MSPHFGDWAAWQASIPRRVRGLLLPYLKAWLGFELAYTGLLLLVRPWRPETNYWWAVGLPVAGGFAALWWLWRQWALLARNFKGESRRLPLLYAWPVFVVAGLFTYHFLHYRFGEVQVVTDIAELNAPSDAFFFRLRGPFYLGRQLASRTEEVERQTYRSGNWNADASCYYAIPLLRAPADTMASPRAWVSYHFRTDLGQNLSDGETDWRYQNALAYDDAQLDSLNLADFTYLARADRAPQAAYAAVYASASAKNLNHDILLLESVRAPFAARGMNYLRWGFLLSGLGSAFIVVLLMTMKLRPVPELP